MCVYVVYCVCSLQLPSLDDDYDLADFDMDEEEETKREEL